MALKSASSSEMVVSSLSGRRRNTLQRRTTAVPYLFLLPFGLFFIVFFIVPIVYALYQSLFRSQRSGLGLGAPTIMFNGLGNYKDVLGDQTFFIGLGRVFLFGIVQVPVMLGVALLVALLLDSQSARWKGFFRTAFFIPYAIPGVVAALIWGYLYTPQLSPFVQLVKSLGLGGPDFLGAGTILWSMANISTWTWTGYNMLIIIAALQAIPTEIYEAARLDGCTGFKIARYIKIPMVAPALVLTCIFSIIGTLQLFTEPLVLSSISNNVTTGYTPNLYAYYTAFSNNNYYYTSALSVMLAVVSFILSFGFLKFTQRYSGV
ncbi:carbohydrate ABC transporter permease [Dictyobacter aurantiacus]|uniref:Sugar ABC transporter permease n=1 Tax=Dictyobacter aurantiacus TaxID=1936993 RepID=A0A401Z8I7_9CHLR|nr:sugar ABC transporter permease [Dictyobacter aurantiacus]GCE03171.1 sugar ABC transporter permease [Dictyobacter aurantiacus]